MLKLGFLALRNLRRNRLRTALTALAVVVLVAIYTVEATITGKVREMVTAQAGQSKLLVSERWVEPSAFPIRYVPEIVAIDGVEEWAAWNLYIGLMDEQRHDSAAVGVACRPETLISMTRDMQDLDPALVEALKRNRTGALVGSSIMETMRWRVGQRFTCLSTSHPGKNLEFTILGLLPEGVWSPYFFFRLDYFQEATEVKDSVSYLWLRMSDPQSAQRVAAEIEHRFQSRTPSVKVETESAGVARFARRTQVVFSIIEMIIGVLLVNMIVVLSNSIAITVRERRVEMAVMKVLGFQPGHIMALVIGEAVFVGAVSGAIGAGIACGISLVAATGAFSSTVASFSLMFPIVPGRILEGALLGALVGLCGSFFPALGARKVRVSDVFAQIA